MAEKLRIELQILELRNVGQLSSVLDAVTKGHHDLLSSCHRLSSTDRLPNSIADYTLKHRLAGISMFKRFAQGGGLMSYGPNQLQYYKRLSVYIDRILKGAKPADLPIEQPTKVRLGH